MKQRYTKLKRVAMAALTVGLALGAQAAEPCTNCITFTASEPFGIKLTKMGSAPTVNLEYSTDQLNWSTVSVSTDYNAANDGGSYKIHFRGSGNKKFATAFSKFNSFASTAGSTATAIACSGNIMTLLDYQTVASGEEPTMEDYAFVALFYNFAALTAAPELPATTLVPFCYYAMFNKCMSLTAAPALPATTLSRDCYEAMFLGCTSLTAPPALNATKLASMCYQNMFKGCTSLTDAPALPATTLILDGYTELSACYSYMFSGCTSLTNAPALPATTLSEDCYKSMFQGCTSLTAAPALPAMVLRGRCYSSMFQGCTSLTAAPALNATTMWGEGCYMSMFQDCTSLTAAPALPVTTLWAKCYQSMFQGCTSLTAVPELNATTLTNYCYYGMFSGCTSLRVNKAAPGKAWKIPATTGEGATNWGKDMFTGTAGDVPGTPDLNTTYYTGAKKEVVGDVTLFNYGGQTRVDAVGELTKALADSIKDKGITNLIVGTGVTGVGEGALAYWHGLKDVKIGESVTNIGDNAFFHCTYVTNLVIGANVEKVGANAFNRCRSLESITFGSLAAAEAAQETYKIVARITMDGETPVVDAVPEVKIDGYTKTLKGKEYLTDPEWETVTTPLAETPYHFFKYIYEAK